MSKTNTTLLGTLSLAAALLLLSYASSSAYAVINLSQGPNYNTNTNIDASIDSSATFSLPALSSESVLRIDRAQIDAGVDVQGNVTASSSVNVEFKAVQTVGDLQAYASTTVRGDAMVEAINFTANSVEMKYKQKGRFLALVPITFTVTARAEASGKVELDYPWYSFLTVDNSEEIETELRVAVDNALRARIVGSVQAEGNAENPFFTATEQAEITAQMQAVLKANAEGSASGQISG